MKLTNLVVRAHPKSFGSGLLIGCVTVLSGLLYVSLLNSSSSSDVPFHLARLNFQAPSPVDRIATKKIRAVQSVAADQELVIKPKHSAEADPKKPICDFSSARTDVCDVYGDIRVVGKHLSTVTVVASPQVSKQDRNKTWHLKPYPRKSSDFPNVRRVEVKALLDPGKAPACSVNHTVPAVVFSDAGYAGNYFHDFIEVLVPLFQTVREFHGQVQLMVTDYRPPWINKHLRYLRKLSQYEIIDYDHDDRVHCFKRVLVGLKFHRELIIDSSESANGYSTLDFVEFMRTTYSLERDRPVRSNEDKPRLLIIGRRKTRKFVNLNAIARLAESAGFVVVVAEGDPDVAKFARVVNSCDAMLGVHGAGLTNSVFLPTGAVLIQVVPFGKLDWLARTSFADPAKMMKLRYLEYSISVEESSLVERYPRDDPVIRDPDSLHKQGWGKVSIYLREQDVKLDLRRFRPVLDKAFKLLQGGRR